MSRILDFRGSELCVTDSSSLQLKTLDTRRSVAFEHRDGGHPSSEIELYTYPNSGIQMRYFITHPFIFRDDYAVPRRNSPNAA